MKIWGDIIGFIEHRFGRLSGSQAITVILTLVFITLLILFSALAILLFILTLIF